MRRGVVLALALLALARPGRSSTDPADHQTLLEIFNHTRGAFWREGTTWTKGIRLGRDPCDNPDFFKGLICTGMLLDEGRKVQSLRLSFQTLNGTLPASLGALTELKELTLTENFIHGEIPASICQCVKLENFEIARNALTGILPECLGTMQQLYKIDVRANQIEGTIPRSLGGMINLQELLLSGNLLSGTIPAELYDAKRLEVLLLSYNRLTGEIPRLFSRFRMKETASMNGLSWTDFRSNVLEGTYPEVIADFGAV
mmetsp:Transcript_31809/g.75580  ORF Transcript_31809/g.75580 Transcript_31809/m.75580 type:complete len:258 (+) Transcript_31809:91-864(+)